MEEAALKIDLHDKIEHADSTQLRELYGLVTDYFSSQIVIGGEWDELSDYQREKIRKGLEEADAGLCVPAEEVTERVRKKYSLNG